MRSFRPGWPLGPDRASAVQESISEAPGISTPLPKAASTAARTPRHSGPASSPRLRLPDPAWDPRARASPAARPRLTLQRLALHQVEVVRLAEHPGLEAAHQPLQVAIVHVEVQLGKERHGCGEAAGPEHREQPGRRAAGRSADAAPQQVVKRIR